MKKAMWVALLVMAIAIFSTTNTMAEDEEARLRERRDEALKECHQEVQCRQAVKKQYKRAVHNYRTNPEKYWREGGGSTAEGRQERRMEKLRKDIRRDIQNYTY